MHSFVPAYIHTHESGRLKDKVQQALHLMSPCCLCPRRCAKKRLDGESGTCKTGKKAVVASFGPHFGEELPLVGQGGSGTIFFSHCNLKCLFCQNFEISHQGCGDVVEPWQIATAMLSLQAWGCHNINFVSPSHVLPQILEAVDIAAGRGLRIPLVYNCGGYESLESLKLLDGVVDIYMPDFKFWDPEVARLSCMAQDYPQRARETLREMHRQVGDLVMDSNGLAQRGLLVRHLVLPENKGGTAHIMDFIAREISPNTYVNIMGQYRPCGRAREIPGFGRRPRPEEIAAALKDAQKAGIRRIDKAWWRGMMA